MISIILNVYNGEKYISRCVDSVLSQDYDNIELIIVDDGSKDNTAFLADQYALKDDRINVYHTENKGSSGSRRYGLEKVTGEYLIFIDCDDWVESNWLSRLYDAIVVSHSDLAICEYYEEYANGQKRVQIVGHDKVEEYTRDLMYGRTWNVVWNKLIKTSIVREHGLNFFEVLRYWEDVPFSISYSLYCNKIAYVHEPLYHYDKTNESSLTATEGDNIDFNICRVKSVGMIDYHLSLSGKNIIFEKDLIWLKHWIKDAFVRYKKNKERIELWRSSFPEVNSKWRIYTKGKFSFVFWALEHNFKYLVLLNGYYWSIRHKIRKVIRK